MTKLTDREMEVVQFGYELGLSGIGAIAMKLYEKTMKAWDDTPKWRWRRRRHLMDRADMWADVYRVAAEYEQNQARAAEDARA